jgi:hypothetical protein
MSGRAAQRTAAYAGAEADTRVITAIRNDTAAPFAGR